MQVSHPSPPERAFASRAGRPAKRLRPAGPKAHTAAQTPRADALARVGRQGYLGPATVLEVDEAESLVVVQWERDGRPFSACARPALSAPARLRPGDVALALTQDMEEVYLIGILETRPVSPQAPIPSPDRPLTGADPQAAAEVVPLRSKQGALVVEYHPESGKTRVNIDEGDLEFVTRNGSISFNASDKISLAARRLETEAGTVVSKAANVYESVAELAQLQAGRTRTLVKGSCLLKARDAFLKTEADFKIDGEQIHLG
ncbi:MAG: DUF3540 domain-containing protein [Opitutaceae bacterium]